MPPARDSAGRYVKGGGGGTFPSYVRIDPTKVAQLMREPNGPLARKLIEDGEIVRQGAKRRVGVRRPQHNPLHPFQRAATRRPGTLRDSIVKRMTTEGGVLVMLVGSADRIALLHHEGTPPHRISGHPWLVFWSDRVGRLVYTKAVNHPGTRPNRYLTDSLADLRGR